MYITKQQAISFRQLGYTGYCESYYLLTDEILRTRYGIYKNWNRDDSTYSAPSNNEIIEWLAKDHNIHIDTATEFEGKKDYNYSYKVIFASEHTFDEDTNFTTRGLAIEKAIDAVINRLKSKSA